ncbi:MAG: IS110 family transposase [Bacilli bacterium]|nr:IS110 family transposase [Bacilli bacterium]
MIFFSEIKHSKSYSENKATKLKNYASNIISGCSLDSYTTLFLLDTIKQLKLLLSIQNTIISKLIELAKTTPHFTVIRSIPGIGEITCARLIAELGDILRFSKPEQINAFIGIDPIVDQSGKKDGKHLCISKKGNKIARSIFFLIARSMVRKKVKDNPIKLYYYKKKAQPNIAPKVALFACVNKLIRLIHSLCKSGQIYEYSISQK